MAKPKAEKAGSRPTTVPTEPNRYPVAGNSINSNFTQQILQKPNKIYCTTFLYCANEQIDCESVKKTNVSGKIRD